jgi:hypothetical protein
MEEKSVSRIGMRGGSRSKCPIMIISEIQAGNDTPEKLYGVLTKHYCPRTISGHLTRLHDIGAIEYVVLIRNNRKNITYRLKEEMI